MIVEQPLLLPAHKINPKIAIPKPEWFYRLDFIRGITEKKIQNFSELKHFDLVTDQKPSTEIIRRSSFAAITLEWEAEGKLTAPLTDSATEFEVQTAADKKFPQAPFYVIIGSEIIYVKEITGTENKFKFKTVRGKAGSAKAKYPVNTDVKLRRSVIQTNWIASEPGSDTEAAVIQYQPLNRFQVALSAEDPQYAKPEIKTS